MQLATEALVLVGVQKRLVLQLLGPVARGTRGILRTKGLQNSKRC